MSVSLHRISIGVFARHLGALEAILGKAAAYCEARGIEEPALLATRLFPNMYDLSGQVHAAIFQAGSCAALLSDRPQPPLQSGGASLAELSGVIRAAVADLDGVTEDAVAGAADRRVTFRTPSGTEFEFSGTGLVVDFSIPNFMFHVTSAYNILRHVGVDLEKRDFIGRRRR